VCLCVLATEKENNRHGERERRSETKRERPNERARGRVQDLVFWNEDQRQRWGGYD